MIRSRRIKRSEQLEDDARYDLLLRLAAGGMGAVYVGRRRAAHADEPLVAVKRAHAHLLEDPAFRKMFVAEASLASRIRHPNVAGVREVDESDGELLLVMDYVEGVSFAELLSASLSKGRRLPPSVAIRVILDAAIGLHAAHSVRDERGRNLGIVHRDVSPHNVLVGIDGVARIVDFGVAKAIQHDGTNTQSGILKGKAAYMAPEYLRGKHASPQSDVFSLGVVAWEGLTSERLFRAEDEVETMQRILDESPVRSISELVPVDAWIDAAIRRALAKDVRARYATASEFARDLEAAARRLDLVAPAAEVGAVTEALVGEEIAARRAMIEEALADAASAGRRPRSASLAAGGRVDPASTIVIPQTSPVAGVVLPHAVEEDELARTVARAPGARAPARARPAEARTTVPLRANAGYPANAGTVPVPPNPTPPVASGPLSPAVARLVTHGMPPAPPMARPDAFVPTPPQVFGPSFAVGQAHLPAPAAGARWGDVSDHTATAHANARRSTLPFAIGGAALLVAVAGVVAALAVRGKLDERTPNAAVTSSPESERATATGEVQRPASPTERQEGAPSASTGAGAEAPPAESATAAPSATPSAATSAATTATVPQPMPMVPGRPAMPIDPKKPFTPKKNPY